MIANISKELSVFILGMSIPNTSAKRLLFTSQYGVTSHEIRIFTFTYFEKERQKY